MLLGAVRAGEFVRMLDPAVWLYAAAAHLSFDNRMPPEEAAKALQKLLTE